MPICESEMPRSFSIWIASRGSDARSMKATVLVEHSTATMYQRRQPETVARAACGCSMVA